MSYGEKIVKLRKSKGMTQAALGAELNVTYQAVSKWERDEADPDFATMSRIAKLFDVPLSFFEEDGAELPAEQSAPAPAPAPAPEPAPAPVPAQSPAHLAMLGVCTRCGKIVNEENLGESEPALVCKSCKEQIEQKKKEAEEQKARAAREAKERAILMQKESVRQYHRRRNRGLIVSAIITPLLIVGAILAGVFGENIDTTTVLINIAFDIVFMFPFIAQLFWDGVVVSICLAGVKIIGTPGIIFSFDLDGFIFLIVMKILFALLKFLVLMICVLFMAFVAIVVSPFSIVPQAIKLTKGEEL